MQLARHKSGKHTSCLAVTRKPVALGPCLTTYSGKIWSISYLGISELLSNPAGCYWKDSSPGGISWTSTFLFNICSFLTISQQSTRAPNFWNTKGRKKRFMQWCGLGPIVCEREWVWDLQALWQVVFSWQVEEEYHITHILIPVQEGGPDFCWAKQEEELFFIQEGLGLLTLGWVHVSKWTSVNEGSFSVSLEQPT